METSNECCKGRPIRFVELANCKEANPGSGISNDNTIQSRVLIGVLLTVEDPKA